MKTQKKVCGFDENDIRVDGALIRNICLPVKDSISKNTQFCRINGRLRISLNNCEFTKSRNFASDFVSWSQKSRSGEIGQNFKVFLSIQ